MADIKMMTYPVINLAETGRSIERHRRQAGLSVRDLQDFFGFEYPQAIYKWQHGECLPSVDNLLALARVLKVHMEDLLVYDDPGVPHVFGPPRSDAIRQPMFFFSPGPRAPAFSFPRKGRRPFMISGCLFCREKTPAWRTQSPSS